MRVRCPHCQNAIEVVETAWLSEVHCGSCDSRFNLLVDETRTAGRSGDRREDDPEATATERIGRFQLEEVLGVGAFGTVWRATDTELDRPVALKIPRSEQLTPDQVEAFVREARAAAQLNHPGIVTVHEVGRAGGRVHIVSDLVEGTSLAHRLSESRFSARESAELAAFVADALAHAHAAGIVHRDLKPANVLLDREGRPHVTDFGLAKREAGEITMTTSGAILGTPAYMSPEQAGGASHEADARSDVYSLGVVLFEMCTGELPFRGNTRMLLQQVLHDDAPSPRTLNHAVPRDLETICLRCLEKDPSRRFGSATELGDELRRFLAGEPIRSRPIGRLERGWRWCRRHPVPTLALVSLAALVVTSVGAAVWIDAERSEAVTQRSLAEQREIEVAGQKAEVERQKELVESERNEAVEARGEAERQRAEAVRARELAESELHRVRLASARVAWEAGDAKTAFAQLEACPEERRGWEHDYLYTLFTNGSFVLEGHEGLVTCVGWSSDGKHLVSGGADGFVRIWAPFRTTPLRKIRAHEGGVNCLALLSDGKRFLTGGRDRTIRLWNLETGEEVATNGPFSGAVQEVQSDATGEWVVVSAGGEPLLVSMDGTKLGPKLESQPRATSGVAYGGRFVVTGGVDLRARVCDTATGKLVHLLQGHTQPVQRVAVDSDAGLVATTASGSPGSPGEVMLWNLENGERRQSLVGVAGWVRGVALSPDGKRLATCGWNEPLRIWDTASGRLLFTRRSTAELVSDVDFHPDGDMVATGDDMGRVHLWNAVTPLGQPSPVRVAAGQRVSGIRHSPDGKRLLLSSWDRRICIRWLDEQRDEVTVDTGGLVDAIALDGEGRRLVCCGGKGEIQLFDARTGERTRTFRGHSGRTFAIDFDASGLHVASGGEDESIRIWNSVTGDETIRIDAGQGWVHSLSFDPDGNRLVSGGAGGTIALWETASGNPIVKWDAHGSLVTAVDFTPAGDRIVSCSYDGTIKVWNPKTRELEQTLAGHSELVNCLAFHPDGSRVASGGGDKTVRIWDTTTWRELLVLRGLPAAATSLEWSPDGKRLLAGADFGWMIVYDATRAAPIAKPTPTAR